MQDSSNNLVIKSLAPSTERLPLFIVGDVHGCARELAELIETAKKHISKFQLILVGDLFTKGPDPVGVFELIQEHSAMCIKGNHDWALWSTIQQAQKRSFHTLAEHTKQTLHLIRYHKRAIFDLLCSLPHAYTTTVVSQLKRSHWEKEYPLIIVHAGIDSTKGLLGTTERMLLTARYVRWDSKTNEKKLLVVPSGYRSEVLNSMNQNNMSHENNENNVLRERFRWHELHNGPALIVFGHDAKQGLFRKTLPSGRPICVGIDTGCTYGNSLTGYFPEVDLAIQVRSQRKYFDIKKNIILLKPHQNKHAAV
ncbi:metallophosphoesterase [Fluviispira vulneris]|uniref:metallophosphoesterase n=1 Tax=Fluviispira vulneris TaxID=2763012 RepID=UPI001646B887|nr:metallophosphoesterase [Fluviispira vulneris]